MTPFKQQTQLVFNHSIESIKEATNKICSLDKYTMEESNELINTYKILVYEGYDTCVIKTHLIRVDENKTDMATEVNNIAGGNLPAEALTRLQNNFSKLLTNILDGNTVVKKRYPTTYHKKTIPIKIILIIVLVIVAITFLIYELLP